MWHITNRYLRQKSHLIVGEQAKECMPPPIPSLGESTHPLALVLAGHPYPNMMCLIWNGSKMMCSAGSRRSPNGEAW